MVNSVANGGLMNGFQGTTALTQGAQWQNPGVGATAAAAGTINNNAGNALMQNGMTGTNAGMPLAQQAAANASSNPAQAAYAAQTGYTNSAGAQANTLSQTAGFNPASFLFGSQAGYTNAAMGGQTALSQYLAGNNNPASQMLKSTANGDYLNSNPYIDQAIKNANQSTVDQFNNSIAPGIDSTMAAAGRLGSNAYASARNSAEKTTANAMATNAGNMMAQNYANERSNQLNAQNAIGALYNSDVGNLQNSLNSSAAPAMRSRLSDWGRSLVSAAPWTAPPRTPSRPTRTRPTSTTPSRASALQRLRAWAALRTALPRT